MLRIGDFAGLSQVSVKALRFYDEIGLLKPTFVDRDSGYRYYAPQLLPRLNRILAFNDQKPVGRKEKSFFLTTATSWPSL
jgi:DNA-binding transcriptional MerR regulator